MLSERQRAFVREYVVDFNGAAAVARAGYQAQPAAARVQASRLLSDANVQTAVRQAVERRVARTGVTADRVVTELARIGFSDLRRLFNEDGSLKDPHEWDDDAAAAVASIEVFEEFEGRGDERKPIGVTKKIRLWDKNKSLDVLAKHTGVYRDTIVNIFNLVQSPEWAQVRTVMMGVLEEHPKVRAQMVAALAEYAGPSANGQPATD